jgi:rubrerythrin
MVIISESLEVFEMAMQMEQVGKDFYEALAVGSDDAKVRQFCLSAAKQEAQHFAAFRAMKTQWTQANQAKHLSPETIEGLRETVKGMVQPDPSTVQKVAIGGELRDALNMAIQMEQDSVRFYEGILHRLPDCAKAICPIIREEQKHANDLQGLVKPA